MKYGSKTSSLSKVRIQTSKYKVIPDIALTWIEYWLNVNFFNLSVELSFWYKISGYCHCGSGKNVLESKSQGRICEYKINTVLINELKLEIEKLRPWKSILKSWNAFCFLMGQDIIVSCNHNLSVNIFKSIILYKRLVVARLFLCPVIASWPQKINHSKNTKKNYRQEWGTLLLNLKSWGFVKKMINHFVHDESFDH